MISKTVLPILGALAGTVVANPIQRAVAEAAANAPEVVFSPAVPGSGDKIVGGHRDLALLQEDNFYWTHDEEELLANLTVTAKPAYRLLNEHNFADLVGSVDCSDSKEIKIEFLDNDSVGDAKSAWNWVGQNDANTLIYVVDAPGCGGEHGRQPYQISSVSYDDAAGIAKLAVQAPAEWEEFAEDATVHIGGDFEAQKLNRRLSYSKKAKISLEHSFKKHFYDASIGLAHLSVDCSDCGTHGTLETDIKVSTKHGFSASAVTADNVNIRFAVGVTASASIPTSHTSESIQIIKYPLAKFKIAKVVTIEPEITVNAVITVSDIKGSVTAVVGSELDFANGQSIAIGEGSTGLHAKFQRIGPTISGHVDATARINPLFTLDLSGKILKKHVTGGLGLAAPYLAFAVGADVNEPSACSKKNSAHFSVDVGAEVDAFYGFGRPGDEPHKKSIYNIQTPLLKECVAF